MTARKHFLESPDYFFQNNIFYNRSVVFPNAFEKDYISLRQKENRLYPDEIVKVLPKIPPQHALRKEWLSRKFTLHQLLPYLREKKDPKILEVGCGNGWLCRHLASLPGSEVVGVDVNETELLQASKVFSGSSNLSFAYADIVNVKLPYRCFDHIILSASIQYFPDIAILLNKLLDLLVEGGEIHIVDSAIYRESEVRSAQRRSQAYFRKAGFPSMGQHYHHHTWDEIKAFDPEILYNPNLFLNKIRQKFCGASRFHWIKMISKERGFLIKEPDLRDIKSY